MYEYTIESRHKNSHVITTPQGVTKKTDLLISDLHWDNPKCDRKLLKKHLDQALERGAGVFINGDAFCFMQGKYDRRGNKSSIRPEHNTHDYFDAVIDDAVEFFGPYAEILVWIAYGNHETGIVKRHEFDPLRNFVERFNERWKQENPVALGGYRSWLTHCMSRQSGSTYAFRISAFHGSGGGGVVTKSAIPMNRALTMTDGVDMIWQGHYHNATIDKAEKYYLTAKGRERIRTVWCVSTPTYKEEWGAENTKGQGWHVETGKPPKPLGGVWVDYEIERDTTGGTDRTIIVARPSFT